MINLLLNSKEAIIQRQSANYHGEIDINGYKIDDEIIVVFLDNGIGMDENEIGKAFEIFYTTKDKGSGLGLPITRQIIERNNATISIDSRKNEYTKITLRFQLKERVEEGVNA